HPRWHPACSCPSDRPCGLHLPCKCILPTWGGSWVSDMLLPMSNHPPPSPDHADRMDGSEDLASPSGELFGYPVGSDGQGTTARRRTRGVLPARRRRASGPTAQNERTLFDPPPRDPAIE